MYVGSWDKKLYALDAATGTKKWEFVGTANFDRAPTFADNTIFVSSGTIHYAIDAATGTKKWSVSFVSTPTNPVFVNDVIYLKSGLTIYAFDAKSGKSKWSVSGGNFASSYYYDESIAVVDGLVYAPISTGITAIDAATSVKKREYTTEYAIHSPTIANGTVFIRDGGPYLYSINATTGKLNWKTSGESNIGNTAPIATNSFVFQSINNSVDSATGKNKWGIFDATYSHNSLTFANNMLYGGGGKGGTSVYNTLYAADALTGKKKWEFNAGGEIFSSPCVLAKDGKAYYGGETGMQQ